MQNQLEMIQSMIGKSLVSVPSKFTHWLGGKLLDAGKGSISVEYVVRDDMLNPAKTLHGGVIASMLDDLVGITMFTTGETNFFTTIDLNVNYFQAVMEGERLIATSNIVKQGSKIINMECTLQKPSGELVAKAYTNLMKTNFDMAKEVQSSLGGGSR